MILIIQSWYAGKSEHFIILGMILIIQFWYAGKSEHLMILDMILIIQWNLVKFNLDNNQLLSYSLYTTKFY